MANKYLEKIARDLSKQDLEHILSTPHSKYSDNFDTDQSRKTRQATSTKYGVNDARLDEFIDDAYDIHQFLVPGPKHLEHRIDSAANALYNFENANPKPKARVDRGLMLMGAGAASFLGGAMAPKAHPVLRASAILGGIGAAYAGAKWSDHLARKYESGEAPELKEWASRHIPLRKEYDAAVDAVDTHHLRAMSEKFNINLPD